MFLFYFSIGLAILASVFYNLVQKLTSPTVHPLIGLAATYTVALVFSLLLLPFFSLKENLASSLKQLNWASFALGLVIVGLEVGYLLAYRAGWQISLAAVFSNVATGLILLPIGVLLFREKLTPTNAIGILVCILGLYLINKK